MCFLLHSLGVEPHNVAPHRSNNSRSPYRSRREPLITHHLVVYIRILVPVPVVPGTDIEV
jgi:hypothetical protein